MRFSLQRKLLVLLGVVTLLALSSALLLRSLIIQDFKAFGEGRMLDRLYQVQAVLEGHYAQSGRWQRDQVESDLVWAWLSGIDIRLYDQDERLVLSREQAIQRLSPIMQQRIAASTARMPHADTTTEYQPYPLFYQGEEIGHIEARLPRPLHEAFFIRSSNRFLAYSVIGLGAAAILLSILAARRISRPLQELTRATAGLAEGTVYRHVTVRTNDEIGQLAASFNRMVDTLEAQERLRKQLVSNAAHELRTPLMVIRGELEGMLDGLLPITPESLQSLHDEVNRLSTILDGVDELTRAQAGLAGLDLHQTRLLPFFNQIVSRFARQADEQQIALRVIADDSLTVPLDPDQFTRILINLISNALRAMPQGGTLTLTARQSGNDTVSIALDDTGYGIAPEELPHIFERFYKGKQGGLGLGLAIVKELVEAHHGSISASSTMGSGTSFVITLPLRNGGNQ